MKKYKVVTDNLKSKNLKYGDILEYQSWGTGNRGELTATGYFTEQKIKDGDLTSTRFIWKEDDFKVILELFPFWFEEIKEEKLGKHLIKLKHEVSTGEERHIFALDRDCCDFRNIKKIVIPPQYLIREVNFPLEIPVKRSGADNFYESESFLLTTAMPAGLWLLAKKDEDETVFTKEDMIDFGLDCVWEAGGYGFKVEEIFNEWLKNRK